MGEIFDSFNAPQFIDFECPDNDEDDVDKYFRIDDNSALPTLRKSMSVGNLILFNEQTRPEEKPRYQRYPSLEAVNKANNKKFVSLNEHLHIYQNKTPERFRSKPNLEEKPVHKPLKLTVPCSPALQTKRRQRPGQILSRDEREKLEIEQCPKFKARPLNKKMFDGPMKATHPQDKKGYTLPKPFSFEDRDKTIKQKREQLINKVLEEEKKAREFHAKPIPKSIKTGHGSTRSLNSSSGSNLGSAKKNPTYSKPNQFKAKPPVVLYKEPFVPVKSMKVTEIQAFQFHTDLREPKRQEFKSKLEEKEERLAYLKEIAEEQKVKIEQEEVAKLRKQAQFKARPVRKYAEMIIKPSNKVTEPISPKFHLKKKSHNKENIQE